MLDLYIHVLILVSLMLDLYIHVMILVSLILDLYIHVLILVSLDVRSVHTCSDSCVFGC